MVIRVRIRDSVRVRDRVRVRARVMVRARVKGKVRVRVKVSAIAHFTPQKVHVSCSPTFFP